MSQTTVEHLSVHCQHSVCRPHGFRVPVYYCSCSDDLLLFYLIYYIKLDRGIWSSRDLKGREPQSRAPTAPRCVRSRGVCARTRWPFAGHWAIAQTKGVKTASRGGLRSRIRAPREMAVCHAFGQGGDARWPFARHPASEMAVCQAPGQRDGRLPGIRPALRAAAHPALAKF